MVPRVVYFYFKRVGKVTDGLNVELRIFECSDAGSAQLQEGRK